MKKIRSTSGFSLVEVLIALCILILGLLGMTFLITTLISNNRFTNRMTTATILAQDKMEDIQRLGFNGTDSTDTTYTEGYNSITNYPYYKRITFIDVDNPVTGLKTATVTVYWDSDAQSVYLNTLLYE